MRRMLLALTGLVLALAASALAGPRAPVPAKPAAVTATTFVVSGRGWGHGVGMSQYGAMGYANDGWTYDQILAHFYVGAELGPAPVAKVRVLVGEAKGAVKLRSKVPFRVRDVFGKTYPLPAGELVLGPKLWVTVNGAPTELAGPILFLPGTEPLELDRPYRGQIEVGVTGQKLNAVNVVGLEQYLQGVVPQEMPSAWPDEALKAQAVAARSYALAHRVSGKTFDLYADVRSQVYGGIAGENAAHDRRGPGDEGRSAPLGRQADRRALPFDLGREDAGRSRGLRKACSLSRLRRRPAQRSLARQSLGPDARFPRRRSARD